MTYLVNFPSSLKKNKLPGFFLALEGIDGSGKTTQSQILCDHFNASGKVASVLHFPRKESGLLAELNASILSGKKKIPQEAFQYLFSADYTMLVNEEIVPRLEKGEIVITDRFHCYSSVAYGLFDTKREIDRIYAQSLMVANGLLSTHFQFFVPDMTFYLDVSIFTALERMNKKQNKEIYEKKDVLEAVARGYAFLRDEFPDEFQYIDAERSIDEVTKNMVQILSNSSIKL